MVNIHVNPSSWLGFSLGSGKSLPRIKPRGVTECWRFDWEVGLSVLKMGNHHGWPSLLRLASTWKESPKSRQPVSHFSLSQMNGGTVTATIISESGSQTPHFGSSCPTMNLCLVSEHKSGLMEYSWEFLGRRHPLPSRGPYTHFHHVRPTALIKFQRLH